MWNKELNENTEAMEFKDSCSEFIKINKNERNWYFTCQLMFMSVLIIVSMVLKHENSTVFEYVKNNYELYFENDSYMENTFSYNYFLDKMKSELHIRYGQLVSVMNNISGKGSANIYPDNVSSKKYIPEVKGVTPAKGYISSPYGLRKNPFNSKLTEFHTGIDIAAPKGSFIKAAYAGTVIAAGKSDIAGNYIRISSENNITTLYAHNQFLFVKEGDRVLAGQIIATMGDTGYATGPHLHFEFIVDGIRYNPVYAIEL